MYKKVTAFTICWLIFVLQLNVFAAVGDSGSYDGFNYKVTSDTTAMITKYTGSESEVVVPEKIGNYTVTTIGNTAFQDKKTIQKITLPKTIVTIEDYNVFWYCTSLKSINLPDSLTYLAAGAFSGCSSLEEIVIPNGITKLSKTFRGCSSLRKVVIPDSVTSMDLACFYNSALSGTTLLKNIVIYCSEGSYAQAFAEANGFSYVIQEPKPEPSKNAFMITHREVTVEDSQPQIDIQLKNNNYEGVATAYAAVYEEVSSVGDVSQLYDIASMRIDIKPGNTTQIPFTFSKDIKENLTYKIILLDEDMNLLLHTVERALVDKNTEIENYPKMNLFESNSSNSSWDKAVATENFGTTGWANLAIYDKYNYLPAEAYRSFPEIVDEKVTLDFDFSMSDYMEDTRFSVLDGEDVVVGFVTKGSGLYLEQPDGSLLLVGEYKPYTNESDEDKKCYVRTEFDLQAGCINFVRVDGKVVCENLPLTKESNRVDGFDVLTGVSAIGRVLNRQVRINSDYIVNEDFTNKFGVLPQDWTYQMSGSTTSAYEINSRVPDRFSVKVDTTNGDFKAVKKFQQVTGNPVFEIMTLQPQKREGLAFFLKSGDKSVLEISANGEKFVLKTDEHQEEFYQYQANVWYGLKAEVDLVNSKVNIYVNNKKMLSDIAIDSEDYQIDSIEIFASQDIKNFVYDDVKLYHKRILPSDYVPQPVKPTKSTDYVVGMQVCNLWTEGQYNKSWDSIKSAPNRLPAFGSYDEGNPEMNDWEIKWLSEHGIDFEWIWAYPNIKYSTQKGYQPIKPNVVREGHYIYDGFMNAEYSDMMQFAISFENDSANYSDTFKDEFFEAYVPYWIEYYFKDNRYLKIDGRPVFGIYVMDKFLGMFGTMGVDDEIINQNIAKFRQMCVDAGVGNPYIISHGFGYTEATFKKYSVYDIDCISLASWPKHEGLTWQKSDIKHMAKFSDKYDMDFVVAVQPQVDLAAWDSRTGFYSTGSELSNHLTWVKNELPTLITHNDLSKQLMSFLTWNEYGEGHIMMPTKKDGFTYLDSVRNVFVGNSSHADVIPQGEQVKRINRMVDNDRLVTTVRENPIPNMPEDTNVLSVKKGWYFSSASDYDDWSGTSTATIAHTNGKLIVSPTSNEPVITLTDIGELDLYDVTYVKVRMKGNTTSCGGNIKWTTDIDNTFDDIKRTYLYTPVATATTMQDYYIPIGQSVKRIGKLTGLQLTPGLILDSTQKFEIESIELLRDSRITNDAKIVCGTKTVPMQDVPVYQNETLMVPLREIADVVGGTVHWYAHNNSYVLYHSLPLPVIFEPGNRVATRGGVSVMLPEAPYCVSDKINDTVYVPQSLLEDALQIKLEWQPENQSLVIYTDCKTVQMPPNCEIVKADYLTDTTTRTTGYCTIYSNTRSLKARAYGVTPYITFRKYFSGIATSEIDYICAKMFSAVDSSLCIKYTLGSSTSISNNYASELYEIKRGENILCIPVSELKGWREDTLNILRIEPLKTQGEFELSYVALVKQQNN